eukprot:4225396-Karenia_brevis.AAC.1
MEMQTTSKGTDKIRSVELIKEHAIDSTLDFIRRLTDNTHYEFAEIVIITVRDLPTGRPFRNIEHQGGRVPEGSGASGKVGKPKTMR